MAARADHSARDLDAQRLQTRWELILVGADPLLANDFRDDPVDRLNEPLIEMRKRRAQLYQIWIRRIAHEPHDQFAQADMTGIALRRRRFRLGQTLLKTEAY